MAESKEPGTLQEIYAIRYGKVSDKWSLYLAEYDRLLAPYRTKSIRLLEIGVQNGGSLELWSTFFGRAKKIVGCDINPDCARLQFDDARISLVVADANTEAAQQQIMQVARRFDLIIDDGSHQSGDIVRCFARYFPLVEEGGFYIVEDLHCSYWQEASGGLYHPASSIAFFKRLVDIMNHEHWGVDKARSEFLKDFELCYGARFNEGLLRKIHSIEFLNSLCVIRKQADAANTLGARVVAGESEMVESGLLSRHGSGPEQKDQSGNTWAASDHPSEEEFLDAAVSAREQELQQARAEVARLQAELPIRDREIGRLQTELPIRDREIGRLQAELPVRDREIERLQAELPVRDREIERLQGELSNREQKIEQLQSDVAKGKNEIATLEECIVGNVARIADLGWENSRLVTAVAEGERALSAVSDENAELRKTLADSELENSRLAAAVAEGERTVIAVRDENSGLTTALAERQSALDLQTAELAATRHRVVEAEAVSAGLQRELALFRQSSSWRITKPLRWTRTMIAAVKRRCVRLPGRVARRILAMPGGRRRLARNTILRMPGGRRLLARSTILLDASQISTSGLFDRDWYIENNPDVRAADDDPLLHFLRHGAAEGRDPNPLFDTDWYLRQNPDVRVAGVNPLTHYLKYGAREGRDPNPLFDSDWYLQQNRDVRAAGINPLAHYLRHGAAEGRATGPRFDGNWYLQQNLDVHAAGVNPLAHYLHYGAAEGRKAQPLSVREGSTYQAWIEAYDTLSPADLAEIQQRVISFVRRPQISVLMQVREPELRCLRASIASVRSQIYPEWELCIAGTSTDPGLRDELQEYASVDHRIKVAFCDANDATSAVLNRGFSMAGGEFIALLGPDDILPSQALYWVVAEINANPDSDLIYSDEDRLDQQGERFDPYFKPDWNQALILSQNVFLNLGVYRRALVEKVGGFRAGFDENESYDLVLRCIEATAPGSIRHVPRVLYHRRASGPFNPAGGKNRRENWSAGARAIAEHLARKGIATKVTPRCESFYQVNYPPLQDFPKISIVMPSACKLELLRPCMAALLERSTYPNFEVLLVINEIRFRDPLQAACLQELERDSRVRVLVYPDRDFNFSWINNWAARQADGSILCLMNDDVEVITPDWLEQFVARLLLDDVAAVGPMLYYPDHTIQHAGVILGLLGVAGHVFHHLPKGAVGYSGRAAIEQDLSCVTAACMAVRREAFDEVGGFNENLAVAFNDVDFCIRLREKGWRIIWTPQVEHLHLESTSLGKHNSQTRQNQFQSEVDLMRKMWAQKLDFDPHYNPNLSLQDHFMSLAFPPRITPPFPSSQGEHSEYRNDKYDWWYHKYDLLNERDRTDIRDDAASKNLLDIFVAVTFDRGTQHFAAASLRALSKQLFDKWTALFIFDCDCDRRNIEELRNLTGSDSRFHLVSRAELQEDSSAPLRDHKCLLLLSPGAIIREHALYLFADAAANSDVRLVYSDEDRLDGTGRRHDPQFKPRFSPELLRHVDYLGPCILIQQDAATIASFVEDLVRGATSPRKLAQLVLAGVKLTEVKHVPTILFHDLLASRSGSSGLELPCPTSTEFPDFSIIIPTTDHLELLKPCLDSIQNVTDYPGDKLEIIVVDNRSSDRDVLRYLNKLAPAVKVIRDDGPFNFSRLSNLGAAHATGQVLLFLNNDTLVDDPRWLHRIAYYVTQAEVGVVGCKLLYPDRTIQHGGVILGIQTVAAHDAIGLGEADPNIRLDYTHEVSAVTGACLAIRRQLFEELGKFDVVTRVAFNDTLLCLDAIAAGYRNIYIKEPLVIHLELKSRGIDDTPEKAALFRREARYALSRHYRLMRDDPYYSPNLCLQRANDLAFPPRQSKPWRLARRNPTRLKILFLSCTYESGHGVAVVIELQAMHLAAMGHEVILGGPQRKKDLSYNGSRRVPLVSPADAAAFAVEEGVDCVIVETPPFFSVVRWLGSEPKTVFIDHGEPPPELFPDSNARRDVAIEKEICFPLASRVFAISEAVRAENTEVRAEILPNGNSHLAVWSDNLRERRNTVRASNGWTEKIVVFNVCRFTVGERYYKGLDSYASALRKFQNSQQRLAKQVVFVLCGKGTDEDVACMRRLGLTVFANVSDTEMADLYCAADIYANFSRWEGYNLGIGQALAMGLPVIASDIPAHRAFPAFTSSDTMSIVDKLAEHATELLNANFDVRRTPFIVDWANTLKRLEQEIVGLCSEVETLAAR